MLYAKLVANCLDAAKQPIWLSMRICMLAWLCVGLLASYLNALQKQICAIDTYWFVSSAVWKLLANCLGNVQHLICVCAWLLASCLCAVQKLIWSLCIPIGLLVLLRAGLHADYLNAVQKQIEAIDTYLVFCLAECGTACTLLGCGSESDLIYLYMYILVCLIGCALACLQNCENAAQKLIWTI